jgi:predicted nucleic acid-binding protein
MKVIVDTNVLFSALLSKNSRLKYPFFFKDLKFFSCNFLFVEIFKHKEKLITVSKLSEEELLTVLEKLLRRINFVREEVIPKAFFDKAYSLCRDIDEKDTPFVALTLFLKGYLWTGDKELKEGLKKKGFNKFFEP